jgi:hypothetical protein
LVYDYDEKNISHIIPIANINSEVQKLNEWNSLIAMMFFTFSSSFFLFFRFFAITTLWPALHSRREIENTLAKYHAMMPKGHVERINYILENKLN